MVALLFVCVVALAAASIGYPSPQAVCSNCTCGVCKVFRSEEQEIARVESMCAEKEIVRNGNHSGNHSKGHNKCADSNLVTPEMCSPGQHQEIVVVSDNITNDVAAGNVIRTVLSLSLIHI